MTNQNTDNVRIDDFILTTEGQILLVVETYDSGVDAIDIDDNFYELRRGEYTPYNESGMNHIYRKTWF